MAKAPAMVRAIRNLSVKSGLILALVLMAAVSVAISGLGFYASNQGERQTDQIENLGIVQGLSLNRAINRLTLAGDMLGLYRNTLNEGQRDRAEELASEISAVLGRADGSFTTFMEAPKLEAGASMANELQDAFQAVRSEIEYQLAAGNSVHASALELRMAPKKKALIDLTGDFIDQIYEVTNQVHADMAKTDRTLLVLSISALVLGALVAFIVYLGLMRGVVRPLEEAVGHFTAIARLDLSNTIPERGRNEVGRLFSAMREMQQSLLTAIGGVRDASASIHVGTSQIAAGNADLSSRTEQQAASLEETAASMEEMTSTVHQNADNARQASSLANDASVMAERGGLVMDEVSQSMQGISERSRQIADIIGMIDAIAFQTNILALNASVEAARAGNQGRGFAVVADEVRNLAGRSSRAAKDIKELIEATTAEVQQGSSQVETAGTTVADIVNAVKRVSDFMDEIAVASQEQRDGIEQVSMAVTQMEQVTQQNAALVQEASSAATSLADQTQRLESVVATFRLAPIGDHSPLRPALAPVAPEVASAPAVKRRRTTQEAEEWEAF
ncbi:methyl-accepting chemotaxis protein [Halomonas huangheensis]|uniref:methyl-accepting chemotaxis protein n=1 Tax=Halomonas huangheensis TaxID=1178482 RepID=UPI0022B25BFF|nr:methyl-accepting chemotaxis protein [Halomonas huangheensis]